ncbi:carbamate kinase [Trinickia sp. NRRL B-1857]|uniref:amino acid kinase family protein n=1 Tax=Trinickia sp. NRRL B-1857 TaxID=3162879 RepID=UPI003D2B09C5
MRIVIALADNALRKRGEHNGASSDMHAVRAAATNLASVVDGNDVVVVHDIGLPADIPAWAACVHRTDAVGAHDGLPERIDGNPANRFDLELRNCLASGRACATLLPMVEVDGADPAFEHPNQPIGAVLVGEKALADARAKRWSIAKDSVGYRRVVPNLRPVRLPQSEALRRLVDDRTVVICAGGVVPVVAQADGAWHGVEAVVDPYSAAELIAEAIEADLFVIVTEMAGVFLDWGTANSKLLRHGHPHALREFADTAGAMGPKLRAASYFVERTGRRAAIGALADVERLVDGTAGTTISCERADPRRFAGGSIAY